MSNQDNNRVLIRVGARKISQSELGEISGGFIPTRLTVLATGPSNNPDRSFDT